MATISNFGGGYSSHSRNAIPDRPDNSGVGGDSRRRDIRGRGEVCDGIERSVSGGNYFWYNLHNERTRTGRRHHSLQRSVDLGKQRIAPVSNKLQDIWKHGKGVDSQRRFCDAPDKRKYLRNTLNGELAKARCA